MVIATIGTVVAYQDVDTLRVWWTSGMDVDADGANGQNGKPFAYRFPEDNGLDSLQDGGWPHAGWTNVFYNDGTNRPKTDGKGNAYSKTSYLWTGRGMAGNSVDATTVPYVVVNPHVRQNATGIVLGCRAEITYNNKTVHGVVADVGPGHDIGEGSVALAEALGIPPSPRNGGIEHGVLFELFPGQPAVINNETYNLIRLPL